MSKIERETLWAEVCGRDGGASADWGTVGGGDEVPIDVPVGTVGEEDRHLISDVECEKLFMGKTKRRYP